MIGAGCRAGPTDVDATVVAQRAHAPSRRAVRRGPDASIDVMRRVAHRAMRVRQRMTNIMVDVPHDLRRARRLRERCRRVS
jgi:hypothetical protein